jgi:alcohol dehydrogenase class IV
VTGAFTWSSPTRVCFGPGVLERLPDLVAEVAGPGARVLLVTGRKSLEASGVLGRVVAALGPDRVTRFAEVPPFPAPEVAEQARAACRAAGVDVVVAIGGGSVLDVAKAAAILATHDGALRDYAGSPTPGPGAATRPFERPGLPVIGVPTTSGSSSEVTPFAAFWDLAARRSLHLVSPRLFPAVALVDPELARGMPQSLAAATGVDALTSAIESYWSREASPLSDALNLEVVRLFADHLEPSCLTADPDARAACALAATVSGIAYSNSRPNVCHAVSSPLTLFWGVAHGQAVGVTLPAFLAWNAPAIPAKLPALWRALGVDGLPAATARLTALMARCGLETRLGGLGVGPGDVETLVEHMRWDRVAVLPRPLGREDARAIFRELL